jgi:hypothetical protein
MTRFETTAPFLLALTFIFCSCATAIGPGADSVATAPAATGSWQVDNSTARIPSIEGAGALVWRCVDDGYQILLELEREPSGASQVQTSFSTSLDAAPPLAWTPLVDSASGRMMLRLPLTGDALHRWTRSARSRRSRESTDDRIVMSVRDEGGSSQTLTFLTHGITEAHESIGCRPVLPPAR